MVAGLYLGCQSCFGCRDDFSRGHAAITPELDPACALIVCRPLTGCAMLLYGSLQLGTQFVAVRHLPQPVIHQVDLQRDLNPRWPPFRRRLGRNRAQRAFCIGIRIQRLLIAGLFAPGVADFPQQSRAVDRFELGSGIQRLSKIGPGLFVLTCPMPDVAQTLMQAAAVP